LNNPDIIIIGSGPAGISAALTARNRGKSVAIITNPASTTGLFKAEQIDNYPGLPEISGAELIESMHGHAIDAGVSFIYGRALAATASKTGFFVSVGSDIYECGALIIATGISVRGVFPGEESFLGRGVSYCATCDGMLYRNKSVTVVGLSDDAAHEANFLKNIGCEVTFFSTAKTPAGLREDIPRNIAKRFEIRGDARVEALIADDVEYPTDAVFLLRNTIAISAMMPGIETEGGFIFTQSGMKTSIPGVFAAGDCTGTPYQIAKAVGEGNIAALSAAEYLDTK